MSRRNGPDQKDTSNIDKELTGAPVWLKQQMFPSTDPMTTWPEEASGEEKNGASPRCDHRTSPLSCNEKTTLGQIPQNGPEAFKVFTYRVQAEQTPPQRSCVQLPE